MSVTDPNSKTEQKLFWAQSAASIKKWQPLIRSAASELTERMILLSIVKSGDRVLDIATGIGDPAIDVARQVLPAGIVVGIDMSAERIQIARKRASEEGLAIKFVEGDIENLELGGPFNAVFCRWGLMFLADLPLALRKIYSVLVPHNGVFVAAVWAPKERACTSNLICRVLDRLGLATPPAVVDPFSLSNQQQLVETFSASGFIDIMTETVQVPYRFASIKMLLEYMYDTNSSFREYVNANRERPGAAEAEKIVLDEAKQYSDAAGQIVMPNESIIVRGGKK